MTVPLSLCSKASIANELNLACKRMQHILVSCRGDFGRLGHGTCSDYFLPNPIKGLAGMEITQVACGDTHTIALSTNGKLYAFGRNQNGQLGLGSSTDSLSPTVVESLQVYSTFTAVLCVAFVLALLSVLNNLLPICLATCICVIGGHPVNLPGHAGQSRMQ